MAVDLCNFFDRVVLINLKRRPDRLMAFEKEMEANDWPFQRWELFEAIDGDRLPHPDGWNQGGGTYGCMQSHRNILERAILDNVEALLVLEDDAIVCPDFVERVTDFLARVPDDWDQLMLGGQPIGSDGVKPFRDGIVRCQNVQRTHCYAIRGRFMRDLYQKWVSYSGHCDHAMGPMQKRYNVYAPDPFIFGQARSKSDINGALNPAKFWVAPKADQPVVFLTAPKGVAQELDDYGFHRGYDREAGSDLDVGLVKVFKAKAIKQEGLLRSWIDSLQWEVASMTDAVLTVWMPDANLELVKKASKGPVHVVRADSVEEALRQYPMTRKTTTCKTVAVIDAPKEAVEKARLHGFHTGYWRDPATGVCNGLNKLFALPSYDWPFEIEKWYGFVAKEAKAIQGGIVAVWHPKATVEVVAKALKPRGLKVVGLKGDTFEDLLQQWQEQGAE